MKNYIFIFRKKLKSLIFIAIVAIFASISGLASTYLNGLFLDVLIYSQNFNEIINIISLVFLIGFLSLFLNYTMAVMIAPTIERLSYDFKFYIISHLKKISILNFEKFDINYLAKRLDTDTKQIVTFFIGNYITIAIKTLEIIVITILIFTIDHFVGIIMLLITPIYMLIFYFFKNPIFKKGLEAREKSAEFFQKYTDQLEYMEQIIIEANFEKENEKFNNGFNLHLNKLKESLVVNIRFSSVNEFIILITQTIIFLVGAYNVFNGRTSIGLLAIVMTYFGRVLNNISYYSNIGKEYQMAKAALHRIDELYSIKVVDEGEKKLDNIKNISARVNYSIEDKEILKNIELSAKRGEIIGILGKNGAGKTTLMKIIIGLLKLDNEKDSFITFNDYFSIKDIDSFHMRKNLLAYMGQKVRFRKFTVREAFIDVAQKDSIEDIESIHLSDDIKSILVQNWDKSINDLSGGMQQIISILCYSLKDSDVFILDEPTSNLDTKKIVWFKNMITELKKEKIIFIITHEESMLDIFDKKYNI